MLDQQGHITIIPGRKICNPLNPEESSADLLNRLEGFPLRVWDIAYDMQRLTLSLWPHLEAAGKDKIKGTVPREI